MSCDVTLHPKEECVSCDEIRKLMVDDGYIMLFLKDIWLSHDFIGELTLSIPVDKKYDV